MRAVAAKKRLIGSASVLVAFGAAALVGAVELAQMPVFCASATAVGLAPGAGPKLI